MTKSALIVATAIGLFGSHAIAHNDSGTSKSEHSDIIVVAQVTPEEEKQQAAEMESSGPKKTSGIKNVRMMGTVALAGQFDDVENKQLRARELEISPGGIVAVHRHDGRPGVAYIVSGQMTEHRVGEKGPVVKKAGDTAFEMTGTVHWWKNEGTTVARIVVVDIVPIK